MNKFMLCFVIFIFLSFSSAFIKVEDNSVILYESFDQDNFAEGEFLPSGVYGAGRSFDGVGDDLIFSNLKYGNDFSVSLWVKIDKVGETQVIFSNGAGNEGFRSYITTQGFLVGRVSNEEVSSDLIGGHVFSAGPWVNLIFSYDYFETDNSVMKFYVNGELDSVKTDAVGPVNFIDKKIILGSDNLNYFDGSLDELVVFSRVLSDSEALSLFKNDFSGDGISSECSFGYYMKDGVCYPYEGCVPSFSCTPNGPCIDGVREVSCIDNSCGIGSKIEIVKCNIDICVPNYKCSEWSDCNDGFSFRDCNDINNCRDNIKQPVTQVVCSQLEGLSFSPDEFCVPNVVCGEWSECSYFDDFGNVASGKVILHGSRERRCNDLNKCLVDFIDTEACESSIDLELAVEKGIDLYFSPDSGVCEDEILTLYDNSKGESVPVSQIDLLSWDKGRLNVNFLNSEQSYCGHCYDAIKNFNEGGIDCGGSCKECSLNEKTNLKYLGYLFFVLSLGLFFVLVYTVRKNLWF